MPNLLRVMVMYGPDQDYRNKHSVVSEFYGKRF
ncbi:MAG: hypothetical protein CM15mP12_3370 [Gammaproteobacteria bacterium]|nr:MAG: hypothetical protein CM15mP12_3370 [Gammaproteobacteria bacterium]